MAEGMRIGVDVGGTFTDVVAWDPAGRVESCKVPTTPANPAEGVWNGIAALAPRTGPWATLAHGTTMVTNAIVEHRGAPVGFITTRGFRDVLEIGRMSRLHLYRLDLPAKAEPLVPRRLRREVTERVLSARSGERAASPRAPAGSAIPGFICDSKMSCRRLLTDNPRLRPAGASVSAMRALTSFVTRPAGQRLVGREADRPLGKRTARASRGWDNGPGG